MKRPEPKPEALSLPEPPKVIRGRFTWTVLSDPHDRAQAGARSLIKRAYRRWRTSRRDPGTHTDLEAWARSNVQLLEGPLERLVNRSARGFVAMQDQARHRQGEREHVWSREDHDQVCRVLRIEVTWPGLYPCYSVPNYGDSHSTRAMIRDAERLHGPTREVVILGRRWFSRSTGNSYHSVRVRVNGRDALSVPYTYGYGNQFVATGWDALEAEGYLPPRDRLASGSTEPPWRHAKRCGIRLRTTVEDVRRKRDL